MVAGKGGRGGKVEAVGKGWKWEKEGQKEVGEEGTRRAVGM